MCGKSVVDAKMCKMVPQIQKKPQTEKAFCRNK